MSCRKVWKSKSVGPWLTFSDRLKIDF
jgi:hypothetical protein